MHRHDHWLNDDAEDKAAQRQTSGLVGIAVVLLLLVGGLYLIQQLHSTSMIEDCLMAGRRNCDVLVTKMHSRATH